MTEGDRPVDIRDRAILLLLAVYGLRAGEVNRLRLEDFDWERELFTVMSSKIAAATNLSPDPLRRRCRPALPQRSAAAYLASRAVLDPARSHPALAPRAVAHRRHTLALRECARFHTTGHMPSAMPVPRNCWPKVCP